MSNNYNAGIVSMNSVIKVNSCKQKKNLIGLIVKNILKEEFKDFFNESLTISSSQITGNSKQGIQIDGLVSQTIIFDKIKINENKIGVSINEIADFSKIVTPRKNATNILDCGALIFRSCKICENEYCGIEILAQYSFLNLESTSIEKNKKLAIKLEKDSDSNKIIILNNPIKDSKVEGKIGVDLTIEASNKLIVQNNDLNDNKKKDNCKIF